MFLSFFDEKVLDGTLHKISGNLGIIFVLPVTAVIVPTVIMAILFLGNAVVLYVLFMLRKR